MTRVLLMFIILTMLGCTSSTVETNNSGKSIRKLLVNKQTPINELTSIHGDTVQFVGGKYTLTVLMFFNLDCEHCVNAINLIEETLLPVMDKTKYQFIGVGVKHDEKYLIKWSEKNNIDLMLVADEDKSFYKIFTDEGVPQFFIVDAKGVVRVEHLGGSPKFIKILRKSLMSKKRIKIDESPNKLIQRDFQKVHDFLHLQKSRPF